MKKWFFIFLIGVALCKVVAVLISDWLPKSQPMLIYAQPPRYTWEVQSIDTMKYSRDLANEKLGDAKFDVEIERQVKAIADTGATHIALGTPYDEKFFPFTKRWVDAARKHHLNVWFRGNWSGWEGWFGFDKTLSRAEHIKKTQAFIVNHPDIFADGDIFSSCPECENGGPGDPRANGDVAGHRAFLIDEYTVTKSAFATIHKKVRSNFFSMNGDVARLVMDKKTTSALDGMVTIDHYVATPEKLAKDMHSIAQASGGKIMLGEWGVSIPDIHGPMSEDDRVRWIDKALQEMRLLGDEVEGMNYWLATGGGTQLWSVGETTSKLSETLARYYTPYVVYGRVTDEWGAPIDRAEIQADDTTVFSDERGRFEIRSMTPIQSIRVQFLGYDVYAEDVSDNFQKMNVALVQNEKSALLTFGLWLRAIGMVQ